MRKSIVLLCLSSVVSFVFPLNIAEAGVVLPSGLAPGSQYQLIFVTANGITGTNGSIATYNTFVANQAALGVASGLPPGLAWRAVVSTADGTNANVNAPSGAYPVYTTSGIMIATAGIYSGSVLAPVLSDQYGAAVPGGGAAYTGSTATGSGLNVLGGFNNPQFGRLGATNSTWLSESNLINGFGHQRIYALSELIAVPIPEASSAVFGGMITGLLGFAIVVSRIGRKGLIADAA